MFLREKVNLNNTHLIHFGLTSEDVNNLAYNFLLKEYLEQKQLPQLRKLLCMLCGLADQWKTIPFPAGPHGQKASPTTAGKEIAVFLNRTPPAISKTLRFPVYRQTQRRSREFFGNAGGVS